MPRPTDPLPDIANEALASALYRSGGDWQAAARDLALWGAAQFRAKSVGFDRAGVSPIKEDMPAADPHKPILSVAEGP